MSAEENRSARTAKPSSPGPASQVIPGGEIDLGLTSGFTPLHYTITPPGPPGASQAATHFSFETHIGPLPPARELAKYAEIDAQILPWMLREAELNAAHIRLVELQSVKIRSLDEHLHRLVPATIVLATLCASTFVAIFASPAFGSVGIGAVIIGVATAYFSGQKRGAETLGAKKRRPRTTTRIPRSRVNKRGLDLLAKPVARELPGTW